MNDNEYLELVEQLYQKIEDCIEESGASVDCDRNAGLLTLEFDNRSKLIINRQQPLQQVWLATIENGHHYDHKDGLWVDDRSGAEFLTFLSKAIYKQSNENIVFD
ncbi:frataxin-like protein [Psychromonas sp. PRT-SC03]|nr:frataxin-like protein [Psychromonas sp. PRT-SC03]